jgi:HD-GYP domain-containing protein (c-di-GMP phosphodiesterase class II)
LTPVFDETSRRARMMGIAEIFEALTAENRPYKGCMKLSQALAILDKFSRNGHIDPDLHRIFVDSQVYRRYADAYLKDSQSTADTSPPSAGRCQSGPVAMPET